MWAVNTYGEGVNYEYHFEKGLDYCFALTLSADTFNNATPNPNANFNVFLTPDRVEGAGGITSFATPTVNVPLNKD